MAFKRQAGSMNQQNKDYYQILGIGKNASVDEIKKAFRRQAVKHHPDQGGDEAKFKEINEAYGVLSNPEKRQRYDQFGPAGLGAGSERFNRAGGFRFDFGDGGLGDIFSSFFGASGRAGGRSPASGRDVEIVLDLDFNEAVFGVAKEVSLKLRDVCPECEGKRARKGGEVATCAVCKGSGRHIKLVRTVFGNLQQQAACPACGGDGQEIKDPCLACAGQGVSEQQKQVKLAIPAGIEDGATIRLSGHGESNRQGASGDLYVVIQVRPDKHFTREGDLILSQETIDIVQASLGAEIDVRTIDGKVKMKLPPGTQSGTDFRLAKKGVPHIKGSGRGSQIVRVAVVTPRKLNAEQKRLLKEFAKADK